MPSPSGQRGVNLQPEIAVDRHDARRASAPSRRAALRSSFDSKVSMPQQ